MSKLLSLSFDPWNPFNLFRFITAYLLQHILFLSQISMYVRISGKRPYHDQLQAVKKLLKKEGGASRHEVQQILGNNVTAIFSVPTAIYSFLRAQDPVPGIKVNISKHSFMNLSW